MTSLARKLRTADYFTLGFGSMVGVGWLVVMDDWLARGGSLGAILGFAVGGAALVPIGYCYGRLTMALPDAASEIAYTATVFPAWASFLTGWMMTLAYAIVCPWEAVAVGKIAAYIFPALGRFELYRVAGRPVFLPQLLLGLALTVAITTLNYRGIRGSATFQNWATLGLLGLLGLLAVFGLARGRAENFPPLFSHTPLVSILLTLQIVPYFMTGFEAVPKCAEEAQPEFRLDGFFRAVLLALVAGVLFYTCVIALVAYAAPWPALLHQNFMTAVAFERAVGSHWIVSVIFAGALLSLLKIFNGNFVAASRLLFAMGRRGLLAPQLGWIHPGTRTPAAAIVCLGVVTCVAVLLGEAILIPITEVGSLASAIGWLAACAAYAWMRPGRGQRAVAAAGAWVATLLVLMKVLPGVPGHFTAYEYFALALWIAAGLALRRRAAAARPSNAPRG